MMVRFVLLFLLVLFTHEIKALTYYEYYAPAGSITSGLIAEGDDFTLNGKVIKIYSGAFHYFRVHPEHWRDTLKKLRAAGLNTVETYMPWNLHNPKFYVYDFGNGTEALSPFLDVRTFVQMAQEEDLFVILRPGPYICAEWDFGGMPSWLLSYYDMHVRTMGPTFPEYAAQYQTAVGQQVADLTFQKGGSIIAVQVENEYGHFGYEDDPRDTKYLQFLHNSLIESGFDDVLFLTSDTPSDTLDWGSVPGVLMTANFQSGVENNLNTLKELQPNRPLMVMEFWTGWFDHWLAPVHVGRNPNSINGHLNTLLSFNSSVNFYMFIGGTNFGFMAGSNKVESWPHYTPIVSSYDYDAPLTEAGDYGPKYQLFKDTIKSFNPLNGIVDDPEPPVERTKTAYGNFTITESMNLKTLATQVPDKGSYSGANPSMEELNFLNDFAGQSYGYTYYTTQADLSAGNSTILIRGHVRDMLQVVVNGEVVTKPYSDITDIEGFGFWNGRDESLEFPSSGGLSDIGFLVENLGRVNYGQPHFYYQKKGLWEGPVYINNQEPIEWLVIPLEFKMDFMNSLTGWESYTAPYSTPGCYRVIVTIDSGTTITDTFLDMTEWNKGAVFVNGFNLGRYWEVGPTKSLYVPAPLLKIGDNEFVIFEQYTPGPDLKLIDHPLLGPREERE